MSEYEKRLKESLPQAAEIVRELRQKCGIIDETPLSNWEVCSLERLHEVWEGLFKSSQ